MDRPIDAETGMSLRRRERDAELVEQALGDGQRVVRAVDVLAEDGELVAPDARRRVLGAQDAGDAPGDRDEQLVARGVAEAVVDVLEAVEVAEEHRRRDAVAARAGQRLAQPVLEQRAVREPGERVVQRLVREGDLRARPLDRVADGPREPAGVDLALHEVVLRALVDGPGAEVVLVGAGEHEHRRVERGCPQPREAVEGLAGQAEVEQDAVDGLLAEPRERLGHADRVGDDEAPSARVREQRPGGLRRAVGLDDQYPDQEVRRLVRADGRRTSHACRDHRTGVRIIVDCGTDVRQRSSCPRMSPEVEQAVGLAREFLHRSGALRVGLLVDRGDDREPAVVECARLAPITVTEDGEREELAHGAQLATPVPPLPEVRQIPGIQADAIAGTVAAPPGGIEMLGRALRDIAALLGGRSIAAADFETIDPETPLGLAARGGEPLVALVGDEQFELSV